MVIDCCGDDDHMYMSNMIEQYDDHTSNFSNMMLYMSNLSTNLFSEVIPARVCVMVGNEGGDGAEDDGNDEEGEEDPETDSFAAVRFLREES